MSDENNAHHCHSLRNIFLYLNIFTFSFWFIVFKFLFFLLDEFFDFCDFSF